MAAERERITLAILALGGQGGGVLADWIREVAAAHGYVTQGTSVPGVAQRTGSTVYYIEMVPRRGSGANRPRPVLALMPAPGDVDVVVASELMEGGRAMLRGFVTADRTTLISSTHRIYAISEKAVAGDGTASSARIVETARRRARRFVGFDMEAAAARSGSLISSVMLGALAASGALPFPRESFEAAIRGSGKAVAANLKGFAAGFEEALSGAPASPAPAQAPAPTTAAGRTLLARIERNLPQEAAVLAVEGVRRLMDYQDLAYAELYLDRVGRAARVDAALAAPVARWLALWMAYEDTVRVADLKIRSSRLRRVEAEAQLSQGQVLNVSEYLHPRLSEVCDILPAQLGRRVRDSALCRRWLAPFFRRGMQVETTSLRWFCALALLAALRPTRRASLRYGEEQARIEAWLSSLEAEARRDPALAVEMAEAPRVLKGYSDTWDRGMTRFQALAALALELRGSPSAAAQLRQAREAMLQDDSDAPCPTPSPLAIRPPPPPDWPAAQASYPGA